MNIDKWIGGYKIRSFPWVDGKRIYFHVEYYLPGQSINHPAWEKTVYIIDNEAGRRLVNDFTDSLKDYVARITIPQGAEVTIAV